MRVPNLEEQFKSRYNRDVIIDRQTVVQDNRVTICTITIECGKKKLAIVEFLTDTGMTDHADVIQDGIKHSFRTHLEAEVYVADKLGEI